MKHQVSKDNSAGQTMPRWNRLVVRGSQVILWGVLSGMASTVGRLIATGLMTWTGRN